jgi:hypothetical protein
VLLCGFVAKAHHVILFGDVGEMRGDAQALRQPRRRLFAGSDGGADRRAIVCSLITTAKLNDREPYAYLKDVGNIARRMACR